MYLLSGKAELNLIYCSVQSLGGEKVLKSLTIIQGELGAEKIRLTVRCFYRNILNSRLNQDKSAQKLWLRGFDLACVFEENTKTWHGCAELFIYRDPF